MRLGAPEPAPATVWLLIGDHEWEIALKKADAHIVKLCCQQPFGYQLHDYCLRVISSSCMADTWLSEAFRASDASFINTAWWVVLIFKRLISHLILCSCVLEKLSILNNVTMLRPTFLCLMLWLLHRHRHGHGTGVHWHRTRFRDGDSPADSYLVCKLQRKEFPPQKPPEHFHSPLLEPAWPLDPHHHQVDQSELTEPQELILKLVCLLEQLGLLVSCILLSDLVTLRVSRLLASLSCCRIDCLNKALEQWCGHIE